MQPARSMTAVPAPAVERIALITFTVAGQKFGVPVTEVQDVLNLDAIANVPLGPKEVRGLINLRGRIVTVIDVRARLGLPPPAAAKNRPMGVTVENQCEFYTLLVDEVGDVVEQEFSTRDDNPATLDPLWRQITAGIFVTEGELLVMLDVARLLAIRTR